MTTKRRSALKICGGLLIPFLLIFTGCGPSNQEIMARERLASAKAAYAAAKANPDVEIHAQSPLRDAGKAVDLASQANNFDEMEHLAYLAERKTQIAVAVAKEQMAENEKTALGMETERLIVQSRVREQRAKVEARESNWLARASDEKARVSNEQARASDAQARKSDTEAWTQAEKAQNARIAAKESDAQAKISSAQARKSFADAKKSDEDAWTQRAIAQRAEKDADWSAAQARASSAEARASSDQARKADAQARKSNAEAAAQTQRAENAQIRAETLEQEIIDMKGRMTDRGIVLTIDDVLFATGTASLSPVADTEIDKLASFLKEYPNRNVLIEGHTDSTGTEKANLDLSIKRANAVRDKLIARDISLSRITTNGLGQNSPVEANDTAAGRERNRRVDIIILNEGVSPLTSK
jgi:outer membrane protein OmpA-like peptidoglycan-associated protein